VPLHDGDAANDGEAEDLLLQVVSGRELAPDAVEFRAALVELAGVYYATGRYVPAIERLTEAVARFPDDSELDTLLFELADSQRLSAGEIDKSLADAMPGAMRGELEALRAQRRKEAVKLYERVRDRIQAISPSDRTDLQNLYLRNSRFCLGDCAYDMGDLEGAVKAYEIARQQYADDPASLVAMVQIVSAYVEQGDWARASTANERARRHLAKFADSVWSTPNLPMERKHWERWLDSRSLLEQRAQAGGPG
jgi:tetratricopeptide (TPR) repeat protein